MAFTADDVKEQVKALFGGKRRGSKGLGGAGNPRETWDDLKASLGLSFVLDPDSVFSVAYWACSRLIGLCGELETLSLDMEQATTELSALRPPEAVLTDLHRARGDLGTVLAGIRDTRSPTTGGMYRQAAQSKLNQFVSDVLVPVVSPLVNGQDRRTPVEARAVLKDGEEPLLDLSNDIDTSVDILTDLVTDLAVTLPKTLAQQLVSRTAKTVDDVRLRMMGQQPSTRTDQAKDDMVSLSTGLVALDILGETAMPVLQRGDTCNGTAYGSGPGPEVVSARSAPYVLLDTIQERIKVAIDGGAAVEVRLPTVTDDLTNFAWAPAPTLSLAFRSVPDPVDAADCYALIKDDWIQIRTDGRAGTIVTWPVGGNKSAPDLLFDINAVVGSIPTAGGGFLIIPAVDVTTAAPVRSRYTLSFNTWVPPLPTPSTLDIGSYVEISGSVNVMEQLGLIGTDDGNPAVRTCRVFMPSVNQMKLVTHIQGAFGSSMTVEPRNTILYSGPALFESATPYQIKLFYYQGSAEWIPDDLRLVLVGGAQDSAHIGDYVVVNGGVLKGNVATKEVDGVTITVLSGTLAAGSYTTTISPPSLVPVGSMLHVVSDKGVADYRVNGSSYGGDGSLVVSLTRRMWLGAYGSDVRVLCQVASDMLVINSAVHGPTGSIEFVAPTAAPAQAELGFSLVKTVSSVYRVYCPTADFEAAEVEVGDVVSLSGLPDNEVAEIPDATHLVLVNPIDGTFSAKPVSVYNPKYQAYNALVTALAAWAPASAADVHKWLLESVRAPGQSSAGGTLSLLLQQTRTSATALSTALAAYRTAVPEPSEQLKDLRKALLESGADRAAALLESGDLAALFGATTDEASSARYMMQQTRTLSRRILGGSVFSRNWELEQEATISQERVSADTSPLANDSPEPPRSTSR